MLSDAELEALLETAAGSVVPVVQPFTGRVLKVHVDVGDRVHYGKLLLIVQHGPPPGEAEPVHAAGVNDAEVVRILVRPGDVVVAGQHVLGVRDVEPLADVRRALLDEAIDRLAAASDHWQTAVTTLRAVRAAVQDAEAPGLRRPVGRPVSGRHHDALSRVGLAVTVLTSAGDCPLPGRLRDWLVDSLAGLAAGLAGRRPAFHRALHAFGRQAGAGRPRADASGPREPVAVAAAVALFAHHDGKSQAVARIADAIGLDESAVWTACTEVVIVDADTLPALAEPVMRRVLRKESPFGPIPAKLAELFPVT